MSLIPTIYKALRKIKEYTFSIFYTPIARFFLFLNGAKVESGIKVRGFLNVHITRRGNTVIYDTDFHPLDPNSTK
jgi:hypothetical protein